MNMVSTNVVYKIIFVQKTLILWKKAISPWDFDMSFTDGPSYEYGK